MAPRKRRTFIIERDSAFAKTIGSVTSDKPDPLSLAVAEASRRIKAEYPDSKPQPGEPPAVGNPASTPLPTAEADMQTAPPSREAIQGEAIEPNLPEAPRPAPAAEPDVAADASQETAAQNGGQAGPADERKDATRRSTEERRTKAAGVGKAGALVEVRVSMLVPTDLAKRAEKWGKSMGLSGVTVLRQSFSRLKLELMAEMKTVKAGDIHMERAESVGPRIQSLLRFSAADYADMQARLDPAGFGILPSMLNHHARARFSSYLDELMANAGY
ncbi:hypothetical protein [Paracoccus sp. MC1862]|uniref:hypothetical protein n=1 Tax=Paracoccus sp. MC1862 TaxID=2760307 RepID=UPI0016023942|nr:hypothetical protein [Paracoccus sp. MC1862]MBB1499122.1 hypothetical protein [Paracoccus sp. MC1862]QQO46568.1 hypothetical protein JGR78_16785 [Paracoccus sp. MC1862]